MVDHCSHAWDLMYVTWRYSFVQYKEGDSLAKLVRDGHNHSKEYSDATSCILNQLGGVLIPAYCQNRKASQKRQARNWGLERDV